MASTRFRLQSHWYGWTNGGFSWQFGADKCEVPGYRRVWKGVPDSAQLAWMGDFSRDEQVGKFPTAFALGRHSLVAFFANYPPPEVTDRMFTPPTRGGVGMQLSRLGWEQYQKGFPPTDIAGCEFPPPRN